MELVTFKSEVSTGQFICVKPEPKKQVAREEKKICGGAASYTYLYILASGKKCGLLDLEIWMVGVCAWWVGPYRWTLSQKAFGERAA